MPYWRMYAHIVWTTKNRAPLIGDFVSKIIGDSLNTTWNEMDVVPHATGYMPDHVHVVVSVPPKIAVADLVRRMKGASSRAVNADARRVQMPTFAWQDEYGSLSFGEKALGQVVTYVQNQKSIHEGRKAWLSMERISEE